MTPFRLTSYVLWITIPRTPADSVHMARLLSRAAPM